MRFKPSLENYITFEHDVDEPTILGAYPGGGSRGSGTPPLTPRQYSCWSIKLPKSKLGDSITYKF